MPLHPGDALRCGANVHALLRLTNEPGFTGLAPCLATRPAGASGLMMLEYAAAAALAEIRNAASPASVGTIVLSRGRRRTPASRRRAL